MSPTTQAAYNSLSAYKPKSSTDAMAEADAKYDVSGSAARLSALKGIVNNLTSSVEAVDPSVTGRTTGTFTTEGQRSALVNKERQPLLSSLEKANQSYGEENSSLTNARSLSAAMASALVNDDQKEYQRLLDQYNAGTSQDQAAESKRQFETNLAEQKRQFDANLKVSAAKSSSGSSSASAKKSEATQSLISDIKSNVADFRKRGSGWTEKTLIPSLIAEYPELDSKAIIDYVYQLRKQYE